MRFEVHSRKHLLILFFLVTILFYTYIFYYSWIPLTIRGVVKSWKTNPLIIEEVYEHQTLVRVVPLLETNDTNISNKYQYFHEQGMRQLPSALIIGVKKGGTRALLEFLRIHPDIRAAGSEVHFFDKNYYKGFQWYRQHMPLTLDNQQTIEKSPSYFITKEAPKRVQLMNPGAKLLVVVRNPVTRAISDYAQAVSKKPGIKSFESLAFINGTIGSIIDASWGPIKLGIYSRYLSRWLKYFPLSQFLFISGERLVIDPAAEISRAQYFLGLKQVVNEKHFYFNSTKGFPCLFKGEGRSSPHCLGKTKGRNHPIIDPKILQRLRDFYRPFNNRFYQMTGINFGWS